MAAVISYSHTFGGLSSPVPLSYLDDNYDDVQAALASLNTFGNYYVDTGAANAYAITTAAGETASIAAGLPIQVKIANPNTTASTIAINGGAAKSIKNIDGTALAANQLLAGGIAWLQYDNTNFQLLNPIAGSSVPAITLLTAVNTTGVTFHDFTVPSGVKDICVTGVGYSTNGTSPIIVQLGDAGGVETSGYTSQAGDYAGDTSSTAGFILTVPVAASAHQFKYNLRLVQAATFLWAGEGSCAGSTMFSGAGSKATSAEVTTVRITMANGTDTVDALTYLNVSYQS